jgi:serine protease Do
MKTVESRLVLGSGKAAIPALCLASVVLLARAGSAPGADVRKAVRAILPATVAVEWRSVDPQSARRTEALPMDKTKAFKIENAKAQVVADAVKDVYRDRLADAARKAAKGERPLSIGVDAASNSVIVSAPASLLPEVERLIETLDSAATSSPQTVVQLLKKGKTLSRTHQRKAMATVTLSYPAGKQPDAVGLASGTVVSSDGLIVTLLGALEQQDEEEKGEEQGEYSVTFPDGRVLPAKVLVDDRRSRLRLLKVEGKDLPHVELADDEAELGQQVVTVYATDPKSRAVAQGIVAAIGESLPGLRGAALRSDLEVGTMSAGAPLADVDGKLVGIIAAREAREPNQLGPAYAVPADYVRRLLDAREGDRTVVVERGFLGIVIHEPSEPGGGPQVGGVQPDSPAAEAGIREGDQLVAVDGQPVSTPADVVRLVGRHKPGDRVSVVIRRDDEEQQLEVTLGRFDWKPQRVTSTSPRIEAVEPQTLHIVDSDGKSKQVIINTPAGAIFQLPQGMRPPGAPSDPKKQPRYSAVYPAPGNIRVQRSDVEKKLDQLNRDVQTLQDHIQKLTEEVQKLREEMGED